MDKTIVEGKKVIDNNMTILEDSGNITVIDNSFNSDETSDNHILMFKDYTTLKQLPTIGAEADIYIVEKNSEQFVLKLYRHEMKPSRDMIKRLVVLSNKYPEDIIRIYDIDFDEKLNRWYEIQEYAKFGTLKDLKEKYPDFTIKHIKEIVKEMTLLLKTIHEENIIHRDIKPDNILVRTMVPLDLIVTDFGISSVLDEEMSKKMTSKSGTRIYFAPESFSGVIGNEVDYWALGMIVLEILENDNIFSGINEGMIAHEIFTKGIKVPSDIDSHLQILLKGLLTRDPKKRWNHKEIFQWLNGDTDIQTYYSYSDEQVSNIKPYTFKDEQFNDLENLLIKMYSEEYYENCKEHIMRGYVTKWLENNDMLDDAILIDKYKRTSENVDLSIFKIFNKYVNPKQFIFMGKLITINNLAKSIGDSISEKTSDFIEKIYGYLSNGTLLEAYDVFLSKQPKDGDMYMLLQQLKLTKNIVEAHFLLRIYLEKGLAYTILQNESAENSRINNGNIKKLYEILDEEKYILPKSLLHDIQNNKSNITLADRYLTKPEIYNFLKYQVKFNYQNLTLDDVVNDIKIYNIVYGIIMKGIDEEYLSKYADIFNAVNKDTFQEQAKEYIGVCSEIHIKLMKYIKIDFESKHATYGTRNIRIIISQLKSAKLWKDIYGKTNGEKIENAIRIKSSLSKKYPICLKRWDLINLLHNENTEITKEQIDDLFNLVIIEMGGKTADKQIIENREKKHNSHLFKVAIILGGGGLSGILFASDHWFYALAVFVPIIILASTMGKKKNDN